MDDIQVLVEIDTRYVVAYGSFPSGTDDPNLEVMTVKPEQVDLLQQPGQKVMSPEGDLSVIPPEPVEPTIQYGGSFRVEARLRTSNATAQEILRVPCEVKHLYRGNLEICGIDYANFTHLAQEGRFIWTRPAATAVVSGITVVSQIPATTPTGWATNCFPQGTEIVFTVKGPSGRDIDWLLVGDVGWFAPEGIEVAGLGTPVL